MTVMVMLGDCRESMRSMRSGSVHTCVASPPYFGLRNYGHADQIGLEPTPDEFVAAMVEVFREVKRVLRDDGTLWLNLGDSYTRQAGDDSTRGTPNTGHKRVMDAKGDRSGKGNNRPPPGMKPKQLLGIPWRVAFALQADGWYLRQDIIWHKPNPMPESVTDRCTKAHEYIFMLSKSPRYYFDADAIKEPVSADMARRAAAGHTRGQGKIDKSRNDASTVRPRQIIGETRNRRSVWTVSTKPFKGAHFATFPPDLIEPCVLAGAPPGGVVLDPFGGAGTTGLVAARTGRNAVLCELNIHYAAMTFERLGSSAGHLPEVLL